jgi:polyphosphate kinase
MRQEIVDEATSLVVMSREPIRNEQHLEGSFWATVRLLLLEHSRVYTFERGGEHTIYIASADLMPRNLDHRVELAAPIESPELRAELMDTLERAFADNQSSWELHADGTWQRRSPGPGERPRNMQLELMELHARRAAEARPAEREATSEPAAR